MVGTTIEHYRIVQILGEGGMGIVYKALDLKLERYVAIKILSPQSLTNPQFTERFKREARNQAKLNHPNIVPVYGFAEARGILGIVMEYVEGETIDHMVERRGRLPLLESLDYLQQILLGASYAHNKGFVHRDLKPSNIIVSTSGTAKIMDFGISKSLTESKGITRTGVKIGTILYMSPEQIKAHEPTIQSDIYSLGITFYETLYGKNPFDIGTEFQIMEAHLKKNPPKISSVRGDIPTDIDKIIIKALQKSQAKRYQTCDEFLVDVSQAKLRLTEGDVKRTKKREKKSREVTAQKEAKKRKSILPVIVAFIILFMVTILLTYFFSTLSHMWNKERREQAAESNDLNFYRGNPAYRMKSDWKLIDSPTMNSINSIYMINNSAGFSIGDEGTILATTDGGESWNVVTEDSLNFNFYDIEFISENRGFIAGENGAFFSTEDGGKSWRQINLPSASGFFDIHFLEDKTNGFVIGSNGTILKTFDSGKNWERMSSPVNHLLYGINFIHPQTGYIVGWRGTILKTMNGGESWEKLKSVTENYLRDVYFVDKETGIVVGGGGDIFRTSNGGKDWDKINTGVFSGLYKVFFFDKMNGVILGSKGEILLSADGGRTWESRFSGKYVSLTGIASTSSKIIVVGSNGTILTSAR